MDSDDYIMELTRRMSEARKLARDAIMKAQEQQKQQHDLPVCPITFKEEQLPWTISSDSHNGELFGNPISGSHATPI